MSKYAAMPCAACGHRFAKDDDVVVCPTCGSPHHRSCFRNLGHCASEESHASGYEWSAPAVAPRDVAVCPHCNAANPDGSQTCQMCKMPMHKDASQGREDYRQDFCASSDGQTGEQQEIGGVTTQEISAYVGSNSPYYLRNFGRLTAQKGGLTWNWSAFLLTYFHFFYRRMYTIGAATLSFFMLTNIAMTFSISRVLGIEYVQNPELLMSEVGVNKAEALMPVFMFLVVLRTAARILCALYSNRIYYDKALADIHRTRGMMDQKASSRDYYAALFFNGSPNPRSILIAAVLYMTINYLANVLLSMIL